MENLGLVLKVNAKDLKSLFMLQDRDYFSIDACNAIIERYEEIETIQEVDIVELCGIFEELEGNNGLMERAIEYDKSTFTVNQAKNLFKENSYIKKLSNGNYLIECY